MDVKFRGRNVNQVSRNEEVGRTLAEVRRRKGKPLIEKRFGRKLASENDKHLEEMQYLLSDSLFNIPDTAKAHRIVY